MTFADKLAALREAATPGPWKDRSGEDVEPDLIVCRGTDAAFACYLVNHAADIEALARAAQGMNEIMGPCDHIDGDGNCQAHFVEANCTAKALRQALAALEGKK